MENSDMRQKFEATVAELSVTLDKLRPGTGPGVGTLLMMAWDEAWKAAYAEGMREGQQSTKTFVIDLLDKRMRKMLQVDAEDGPKGVRIAKAECFHLCEIQAILRGETTCGVYDEYGALPLSTE